MQDAFTKAKHAVAKDSRKISRTFHVGKPAEAWESLQKLAQSAPSVKARKCVAQNAACAKAKKTQAAKVFGKELVKE